MQGVFHVLDASERFYLYVKGGTMFIEKYEIIKEFRFTMEDLDHPVNGRIVKILDDSYPQQFFWETSHYYKPEEGSAGVYTPSHTSGVTALEAERGLMKYIDKFTTFGVLKNDRY